jgi:hypothetical protein
MEVKRSQSLENCSSQSYSSPLRPPTMIRRLTGSKSRLAALAFVAVAVTGVACSDFTGVPASLNTITDSGTVFGVNGAPLGAPSALHAFSGTLIPADANFVFDIAFDVGAAAGDVVVFPQRAIASGLATTHQVSLAVVPDSFEAVTEVPKGLTFRADTAMTIKRNQVLIAQVSDATACGFSLTGTTLYAKVVVTSINHDTRQMQVKYTVDPNCGFRSFASGIPKD